MARLGDRLGRLERVSKTAHRGAEATAAEVFWGDMLDLADRMQAGGDTQHDARLSPRENMARALARGDFDAASACIAGAKGMRGDGAA